MGDLSINLPAVLNELLIDLVVGREEIIEPLASEEIIKILSRLDYIRKDIKKGKNYYKNY